MIKMISLEEREEQYLSETQNGALKNGQPNVGLTNKELFKCDQCDHYFDTKIELKTHVDKKHEDPDFFQCKICKSCFHSKIQLQKHSNTKHLSTDQEEYNFNCKVCGKTFWNSLDLIKHLNLHVLKENIEDTDFHDEPFCCKICGTFKSMNDQDIRNHVNKHVEDTIKYPKDSTTDVTEEEPEGSENERDENKEAETSMNDSEVFAGFYQDGNRITDDN